VGAVAKSVKGKWQFQLAGSDRAKFVHFSMRAGVRAVIGTPDDIRTSLNILKESQSPSLSEMPAHTLAIVRFTISMVLSP
jgi:hypothetical protein